MHTTRRPSRSTTSAEDSEKDIVIEDVSFTNEQSNVAANQNNPGHNQSDNDGGNQSDGEEESDQGIFLTSN